MRRITLLALLLLPLSLHTQPKPPALLVRDGGPQRPLPVSSVEVDVRVVGFVAETRLTLTFENPTEQVLEGELVFPLPPDASVTGFALDIGGELVDGVAVEKQKARVSFEEELRKGVDPGLVEWVRGNQFRTRVYPIPAKGRRTLAVSYVSELEIGRADTRYRLPLAFPDPLKRAQVKVDVVAAGAAPEVKLEGGPALKVGQVEGGYEVRADLSGQALRGALTVRLPRLDQAQVLVHRAGAREGGAAFVALDRPGSGPEVKRAFAPPERVAILWDASGSRAEVDHAPEEALLTALFHMYRLATVEVDLIVFRDVPEPARRFSVRGGDVSALLAALGAVVYDGGTRMDGLAGPLPALAPSLALLFGDGMATLGDPDPAGFRAPVYAFPSGPMANLPFLRRLTHATGGEVFPLDGVDPKRIIPYLGREGFGLREIEADAACVSDLTPNRGQPVTDTLVVTGRLRCAATTLTLVYAGHGHVIRRTLELRRDQARDEPLIERAQLLRQVAALAVFPERNRARLLALGKAHGLVTPVTSLLVLETLEQHVEHEVRPPASRPELREAYDEQLAEREEEEGDEREAHVEAILELWEARVAWWQETFTYPKGFRYGEAEDGKEEAGEGRGGAGAAPPMPRAAPRARGGHADEAVEMDMAKSVMAVGAGGGGAAVERRVMVRAAAPAMVAGKSAKKKDGGGERARPQPGVALKPWDPDTPYTRTLKALPAAERYPAYLGLKAEHGRSPAFFLDVADLFLDAGARPLGLRVLSNVAELQVDEAPLLRVLAHRYAQLGELDLARGLFERVRRLRPEEPQSHRDLALVLARLGDLARAMELLAHVVMQEWDRFEEIELMALMELNALIPKARAKGIKEVPIDPRLIKLLDLDVRIVLTWDADLTDMDLWVIEPSGEKADYSHNRTTIGGLVSKDFTDGYGPEEYLLRRAMKGTYTVKTNFFGSSAQRLSGAVTLQLDLFTNYGRPEEQRRSITLRLTEEKDTFTVGVLEF